MAPSAYPDISDYAFISNCRSCALVSRDASIEWACFVRFDARPVFARLLDRELGGFFRVAPVEPFEARRRYLPDTNVLETTFETSTGTVTVTDCLPVGEDPDAPDRMQRPHRELLVRRVRGVEGSVALRAEFRPRFDYGLTTPLLRLEDENLAVVTGGADALLLQGDLGLMEQDGRDGCVARATVEAGDEAYLVLTYAESARLRVERHERERLRGWLDETVEFWTGWSSRCAYRGRYRDVVVRSALVLKGLTNADTGAMVAAATTSLPEEAGGVRTWDYRYTWLRDSVVLLSGLFRLGYVDEAGAFLQWMRRTTAGRADELQIMYGIGGERLLHEVELGHLEGYRGSRPVRIGNGAWDQFQLDVYGELMAAAWVFARRKAESEPSSPSPFRADFLREIVEIVIRRWEEPDEGVWEVRGGQQHFVFSKLMAWVAIDRGIRLFEGALDDQDLERWKAVRDEIRRRIETDGVDPDSGAFVQAFGSRSLDASVLQIPLLGFLPVGDPRVLATIDEIERRLTKNGLVYRYLDRKDGLPGGEGSFTFCTLWLVSSLALAGKIERAERLFEKVLSHGSDLGLLAEEIDPDTGEQLGNFPQAFSHVGVIRAAMELDRARDGASGPIAAPTSPAEE